MAMARSVKIRHSSRTPGGGATARTPYWTNGSSCMPLVNASRSLRSSQCAAGSIQWACRWLSRCTKSMATSRSSCARAASSRPPSGPDTTGLPLLITSARIRPRPGVTISPGRSASAWAPATRPRPVSRLVCGGVLASPASRSVSTYPGSNRRPPGRSIRPVMTLSTWPSHSATVPAACSETPVRVHHRRRGAGEIPCGRLDPGAGDIASGGQVVEVGVGDQAAQVIDAGREVGAIGGVFAALVEDDLHHRQQQRPVLAGPHRQMQVGLLGGFGPHRVDDDDRRALPLALQRPAPPSRHGLEPIPRADRGIRADEQEVVALIDVGHRHQQRRPVHRLGHHVHRVLVHRPDGVAVVGADRIQPGVEEDQIGRRIPGRISVIGADGIGPVVVDDGVAPLGDVGDRLRPARLDVGIADPAHRRQDAARMVDDFSGGAALGAEVVPAVRVLPVGGDLGYPVVPHRHLDPA